MCAAEGMGLCPWGAIGGGPFKAAAQREEIAKSGSEGRDVEVRETDVVVSKALEVVAGRHGTAITRQKTPYVVPLVGGCKWEHLQDNIKALSLELFDEDIREIESSYPFDSGFPMAFLFRGENKEAHGKNSQFMNALAMFD
jgi:aryl-alcohol dehydrogenase-like predicted oxidoreductase